MTKKNFQKNVLGEKLESCSVEPLTGWYRDGCCNTNETDHGVHTVCAKVTSKFLGFNQTPILSAFSITCQFVIIFNPL